MNDNISLKRQLTYHFLTIIGLSILATVITVLLGVLWWTNVGVNQVVPANYYDNKMNEVSDYARQSGEQLLHNNEKNTLEEKLPTEGVLYQVVNLDGEVMYGTIDEPILANHTELVHVMNTKRNLDNEITYFIPLVSEANQLQGSLILKYAIEGKIESIFVPLVFIFIIFSPFLYIAIFTSILSNRLFKKIMKPVLELIDASKRIKNKDLDFQITNYPNNEIGELSESFEQMRAELKNSLLREWKLEQERRDMVNAIAHDLRTPITIIRGHIEGLQAGLWKKEDTLERYLSTINSNITRISKLLTDMQTVQEVDSFTFELIPVEVDIENFFIERIEEYCYLLSQKEISLKLEISNKDNISNFVLDRERFCQIMDNVLINSIRFTPQNGMIKVIINIEREKVTFHVYDNGPGFQKDVSKIFKKFYQEDYSRSKQKGHAGLGLYIAQTIARKHQGEVYAENSGDSIYNGAHLWVEVKSLNRSTK